MHLHHDRHLQTYVDNLNKALKDYPQFHNWTLEQLLLNADRLPEAIRKSVINNGGGVYNHIFYFNGMSDAEMRSQAGPLYSAIIKDFGSVEQFYDEFKKQALSVFGSGYAWLTADQNGKLKIVTSANQDTPIVQSLCPIAAIDVWEHAYYLKHYNERAAYIEDWFNVANWKRAGELYQKCLDAAARSGKAGYIRDLYIQKCPKTQWVFRAFLWLWHVHRKHFDGSLALSAASRDGQSLSRRRPYIDHGIQAGNLLFVPKTTIVSPHGEFRLNGVNLNVVSSFLLSARMIKPVCSGIFASESFLPTILECGDIEPLPNPALRLRHE
jgi:Fe-Mn family superoxide dismutase